MDPRMGLAQAMAGQGGPPPAPGAPPPQGQPPADPAEMILKIVMKISEQLDALMATEQQEEQGAQGPQGAPPQGGKSAS